MFYQTFYHTETINLHIVQDSIHKPCLGESIVPRASNKLIDLDLLARDVLPGTP